MLDEVGELPLEVQSRLVRAVGDVESRKIDLRLVATTRYNLAAETRAGAFRDDLDFRLAVVRALVPPLRQHKEDIPLLARHFLGQLRRETVPLSTDLLALLMSYEWPGNVRELRNVIERAISLEGGPLPLPVSHDVGLTTNDPEARLPSSNIMIGSVLELPFKEAKDRLIEGFEREYLRHLIKKHGGNLSRAAVDAGIDRNYVRRLLKKHGLEGR